MSTTTEPRPEIVDAVRALRQARLEDPRFRADAFEELAGWHGSLHDRLQEVGERLAEYMIGLAGSDPGRIADSLDLPAEMFVFVRQLQYELQTGVGSSIETALDCLADTLPDDKTGGGTAAVREEAR